MDDGVITNKFRTLTGLENQLLYEIWRIEERPQAQKATRKNLAKALGVELGHLANIISGIWEISRDDYLDSKRLPQKRSTSKKGPPQVYYYLLGEHLVTFPDTAFLLLELLAYPREMSRRINRLAFLQSMANKLKQPEPVINKKIKWAVENAYVAVRDDELYMAALERITCEQDYLKMLAQHCNASKESALSL